MTARLRPLLRSVLCAFAGACEAERARLGGATSSRS